MKIKDIKPLHNLVAIKELVDAAGVIHLPTSANISNRRFVVIAAGPGRVGETGHLVGAHLTPGDVVIFGSGQLLRVRCDDGDVHLISDDSMCAVVGHVDVDVFLGGNTKKTMADHMHEFIVDHEGLLEKLS